MWRKDCSPMAAAQRSDSPHVPVLLEEIVSYLAAPLGGVGVDLTCGYGGHLWGLANASSPDAIWYGVDRDHEAIAYCRERQSSFANVREIIHAPFDSLSEILRSREIMAIQRAILDLGVSSPQIDRATRGFSFQADGALDMRMSTSSVTTAADLLAVVSAAGLTRILSEYGEERHSRRLANAILRVRESERISTTGQLRDIVSRVAVGEHRTKTLARVFQALRIEVNDELGQLTRVLPQIHDALAMGGRMAVVSYHSLEDRIVKRFYNDHIGKCVCPPEVPICVCDAHATLRVLTKKSVRPSAAEITRNPRARSAKLRVAEKIADQRGQK